MDEAIVVFSRKGIFQTTIAARDVRSREHARKLWPLVSPGASRQMVTWVSPSFESGKLRRRSYFRMLPAQHTYSPKRISMMKKPVGGAPCRKAPNTDARRNLSRLN
ncbi:hypothetical protein [Pseudomonas aeruginosa]|uniref:hypothetical protein n=1 Tax=Pseudomonas aeruginosa TaxID=287 RepID=UPI00032B844D|nr:hypothetical protein [Pseudomonas aeruginosa]AGL46254.1 hypothetical protein pOZ176_291 [Pseudomonas aeruginosa PA96]